MSLRPSDIDGESRDVFGVSDIGGGGNIDDHLMRTKSCTIYTLEFQAYSWNEHHISNALARVSLHSTILY